MRLESKSFIGSLVAHGHRRNRTFRRFVFANSFRNRFTGTPVARRIFPHTRLVALFSEIRVRSWRYSTRLKRPEIAAQLSTEWSELGKFRGKTRKFFTASFLAGINPRDFVFALAGDWLGSLFLMAIPWLFFLALGCSLLLRLVPSWRRESGVSLSPLSWMGGVFLAMLGVLMLASPAIGAIWAASRTPGSNLLETLLFSTSFGSGSNSGMVPMAWQSYFSAMLCFVFALWIADSWNAKRAGKLSLGTRLRAILHPPDDDMTRFDLSPLLALAATMAKFFILTVGVVAFLVAAASQDEDYAPLRDNAALILLGLAVVLTLPSLWRLRNPQSRAFALSLARRFAMSQLVFLTLLWGLLWMFAAPSQTRFDAQFTRQLQVGEFQIVRKQLGI